LRLLETLKTRLALVLVPGKERGNTVPVLSFLASFQALLPGFRSHQLAIASVFSGLLLQRSQDIPLIHGQDTPNSDFGQNPHTHCGRLSGRDIADTLLDHLVIGVVRIQRFFKSPICFNHAHGNRRPLRFVS
jgi:hypothetical protein